MIKLLAIIAAVLACAIALGACGSGAPATVTVTQTAPARTASSTTSTTPTSSSSSSSSSSTATASSSTSSTAAAAVSTTTSTTTATTTTTRTETAPAFVGGNPSGGAALSRELTAAIAVLAKAGYTPLGTSTYDAGDTLRVLIGRRATTSGERAFFFDQTIYLGTDAATPSGQISVLSQNDTEVTLGYGIYRTGASAPSTQQRVRFALDMGQLSPLDALPSLAARR